MINKRFIFTLSVFFFINLSDLEALTAKKYYSNLPDFDKNSPFSGWANKTLQEKLNSELIKSKTCQPYAYYQPDKYFNLETNIDKNSADNIGKIIREVAPTIDSKKISFWKTYLKSDGEPELIVAYDTPEAIGPEFFDHYIHFWLIKKMSGKYKEFYFGPFLEGNLLGVFSFGYFSEKSIFVKFLSCTECEPTYYSAVVHFDSKSQDLSPFVFQDDEKHFREIFEYGDTTDWETESRIPNEHSKETPCLIQCFKSLDCEGGHDPDDWWIFKSENYKCNLEAFHELPEKYKKYWDKSLKLGLVKGDCI